MLVSILPHKRAQKLVDNALLVCHKITPSWSAMRVASRPCVARIDGVPVIVILALMGAHVCESLVVCGGMFDASCWFII